MYNFEQIHLKKSPIKYVPKSLRVHIVLLDLKQVNYRIPKREILKRKQERKKKYH